MRQRRLRLDFAAQESRVSWSGLAALLLGLAACASALVLFQAALDQAARLDAEIAALGGAARAQGRPADARIQSDAIARAKALAHGMARRWDRVFLAIESANAPEVALLAIEPDAGKGRLRITAEAKGKNEMLDYVSRLQAAQPLQRVVLDEHEILSQVAEKPVRFSLSAEWDSAP